MKHPIGGAWMAILLGMALAAVGCRKSEDRASVELAEAGYEVSVDDALLLAALVGQAAVIDTLTNYGASVHARMADGRTALMLAAENGHADAAEMLIELGASRHSTADDGRTASDFAADAGFSDVRPNQMIVVEEATGAAHTLHLRGPRG